MSTNTNVEQLTSQLLAAEISLSEKQEELEAQRGMLSAAIDELASQNKNLEEILIKLTERNKQLQQLLYQSSHGLRSPLTSIQGVINLIELEALPDPLRVYHEHVKNKLSHMLEILNSLTALSSLIGEDVNAELIDINVIVSDCVRNLGPRALQNNTTLTITSEIINDEFRSDRTLISSIVRQVVMNAIIFRDITHSGYVHIDTTIAGGILTIKVEDDGEGIVPSVEGSIFNIFVRGSGKSGGSGLGLFIAKKSVELLNGSIEFTRVGGKTIFVMTIPETE